MNPKTSNAAVLLLGTNLGKREDFLASCRLLIIERCGTISKTSSVYETAAWGFDGAPFLNQVIIIETIYEPAALLERLQAIEQNLGRRRSYMKGYISRTIDIDILYFNQLIVQSDNLEIPHPRLHLRRFTLVPLCEILPTYIHPVWNKTHLELLELVQDQSKVSLHFDAE